MDKIIIACKKCKKQMKIFNKPAKYRCPHCKEVFKFTKTTQIIEKIKRVGKDAKKTFVDSYKTLAYRFRVAKEQYKMMKQIKKNKR